MVHVQLEIVALIFREHAAPIWPPVPECRHGDPVHQVCWHFDTLRPAWEDFFHCLLTSKDLNVSYRSTAVWLPDRKPPACGCEARLGRTLVYF